MINKILFGVVTVLLYLYLLRSERAHGVAAGCINLGKINEADVARGYVSGCPHNGDVARRHVSTVGASPMPLGME